MPKPFFTVVIPTYNEEESLPVLLEALKKQTYQNFKIIVVDSFSQDKTTQVLDKFKKEVNNLDFYIKKMKNVSQARNYGASKANGDFLVFFDADVEPAIDFLEKIKNYINKFNLDVLTVWNRPKSQILTGKIILSMMNLTLSLFQKIKPAANGPCIIIKKDLFEKLQGFDDSIVFGEDFDLIQRAHKLKANFKVFAKPILYVSTRRFEKEGFLLSLYKSIKALLHQLFFGPIRKPIFDYQMGGHYYKSSSKKNES